MAKMFYTLEEAAEILGTDTEDVKEMASAGRLQQFRDRDKLMFKRDQVDSLASASTATEGLTEDVIPLADTGMGDKIDLAAETAAGEGASDRSGSRQTDTDDTKAGTGISVFESGEIELADPAAQTHVTESSSMDDEALALESVGSGSGLLDLTRESDDTSLGAELLDEIYPSDDSQMGSGVGASALGASALAESALGGSAMDASSLGGSAVLDGAAAELEGSSIGSGLEAIPEPSGLSGLAGTPTYAVAEAYDPAGSGFGAGALIGVTVVLFIALAIAAGAVVGTPTALTAAIAASLWMYVGIMLGGCILFGIIGMFIGKVSGQ